MGITKKCYVPDATFILKETPIAVRKISEVVIFLLKSIQMKGDFSKWVAHYRSYRKHLVEIKKVNGTKYMHNGWIFESYSGFYMKCKRDFNMKQNEKAAIVASRDPKWMACVLSAIVAFSRCYQSYRGPIVNGREIYGLRASPAVLSRSIEIYRDINSREMAWRMRGLHRLTIDRRAP